MKTLTLLVLMGVCLQAYAGDVKHAKVQEVNFEEMNLKGTVRNPDGAYLVQKRGVKFLPLYDINKNMDAKIRATADLIK